jgi:hypothetical protein
MRSQLKQLRRSSINTGNQSSFDRYSSQQQKFKSAHCRNLVNAQVSRVVAVAVAATATCIFGLALVFILVMVCTFCLVF